MSLDRDGTALAAFIAGTNARGRKRRRDLGPLRRRVAARALAAGGVGRGAVLRAGDGPRPSFSARTPGDDERSGDGDGRLWSASRAVYTFVLIPLVTVLLSVWIDDEPIGAGLVLGGLLVLAGVYVGALRPAASPALQTQVKRNAPE